MSLIVRIASRCAIDISGLRRSPRSSLPAAARPSKSQAERIRITISSNEERCRAVDDFSTMLSSWPADRYEYGLCWEWWSSQLLSWMQNRDFNDQGRAQFRGAVVNVLIHFVTQIRLIFLSRYCGLYYQRIPECIESEPEMPAIEPSKLPVLENQAPMTQSLPAKRRHENLESEDDPAQFRRVRSKFWTLSPNIDDVTEAASNWKQERGNVVEETVTKCASCTVSILSASMWWKQHRPELQFLCGSCGDRVGSKLVVQDPSTEILSPTKLSLDSSKQISECQRPCSGRSIHGPQTRPGGISMYWMVPLTSVTPCEFGRNRSLNPKTHRLAGSGLAFS